MKQLYTTEFGSKLYGTNTPASDTDLKTVVLPLLESLLLARPRSVKNLVQSTGLDHERNTADDVDHEFIPLQVLARDFVGGQTYAVELVFSALSENHKAKVVYDETFIKFCEELASNMLTSNIKAMIGYAMGQTHKYGVKGTRLGSVRKFDTLLREVFHYTQEEMSSDIQRTADFAFATKLSLLNVDANTTLVDWINQEADKYIFITTYEGPNDIRLPAISVIEKVFPLNIDLKEAMNRTGNMLSAYGSRAVQAENNQGVDWKAVSHALRICYEAIDVLRTNRLDFPFSAARRELLLSIKNGETSWASVESLLAQAMDNVELAQSKSTLPSTDEVYKNGFDEWLLKWLHHYYGTGNL